MEAARQDRHAHALVSGSDREGPPVLNPWTIREAISTDAAALATLAETTFRETFGPANSAADMDAYCVEAFGAHQQGEELGDPCVHTIVAASAGALVGYGQLRRGEPLPCVPQRRSVELKRLYVLASFHGTGLAHALMEPLVSAARSAAFEALWLGVWEHNARAQRFYRNWGFREVGDKRFVFGTDVQRDLVMALPLRFST